jgi:sterol desaturase/sphingolipid hydroxylase (fatty acid hydroxylase superfamily)
MTSFAHLTVDIARLVLWLVILAVIFVPLERLFAVQPRSGRRPRIAADLGFYFFNSLVPTALLALPMAAVAALARHVQPAWWSAEIGRLPLWANLVLGFVIGEVGFYWGHRWSHEWRWMWRFHRVHHTPQGLDWLINTRAHPLDMIFTRLCGLVPLYAIGLAQPDARGSLTGVIVILAGTIWGFFIHANLAWRLGPVEHVIASPRFHHWHHVRSGPINRNYASMLPVLDRVFGTLHLPARGWPEAYGVDERAEQRSAPSPKLDVAGNAQRT